jgi:hypothetical protein
MHAEIEITQRRLLDCFNRQRLYLASKPVAYVEELLHRAEDLRNHEGFSVRTAAEINHAACVLVLEHHQQPSPAIKS